MDTLSDTALVLMNKDGTPKKIQRLKTENRTEYQREYMRKYIKKCTESITCDLCGGHYRKHQKYIHDKGKIHNLIKGKLLTAVIDKTIII
jgi:hypothetical protein